MPNVYQPLGKRKHALLLFYVHSCCKQRGSHSPFSLGQRNVLFQGLFDCCIRTIMSWVPLIQAAWPVSTGAPSTQVKRRDGKAHCECPLPRRPGRKWGVTPCKFKSAGFQNLLSNLEKNYLSIFLPFSQVGTGFMEFDKSCNALWYYLVVIKLIIIGSELSYLQTHG